MASNRINCAIRQAGEAEHDVCIQQLDSLYEPAAARCPCANKEDVQTRTCTAEIRVYTCPAQDTIGCSARPGQQNTCVLLDIIHVCLLCWGACSWQRDEPPELTSVIMMLQRADLCALPRLKISALLCQFVTLVMSRSQWVTVAGFVRKGHSTLKIYHQR